MAQQVCRAPLKVDTDSLTASAHQITLASDLTHDLAVDIGILAGKVLAVVGLDPLGQGMEAAAILTTSSIELYALSETHKTLATAVESARDAYIDVENLASQILQGPEGFIPELFYLAGERATGDGAIAGWIADKTPFASIVSHLTARLLFGMGYYADLKLNGEQFARKRRDDRLKDTGMSPSWRRDAGSYFLKIAGQSGLIRPLAESSVRVERLDGNAEYEEASEGLIPMPVTAADWSHNLELVGRGEGRLDALDERDGEILECDGVRVQLVRDAQGTVIAANVYLPGTDENSSSYAGGLTTWETNLAVTQADGLETLDEGTAMMQLTDQALEKAGVGADIPVNIGGFSQGAITASALSTNKEFTQKYKVNYLYLQGAPVGDMKVAPEIPTLLVKDKNDPVPRLQGSTKAVDRSDKVRVLETDYRAGATTGILPAIASASPLLAVGSAQHAPVHGYSEYATVLATSAEKTSDISPASSNLQDLREQSEGGSVDDLLVSGSTFEAGTSRADMTLQARMGASVGSYQIAEDVFDLTPTPLATLPEVPEDYRPRDTFATYIEPMSTEDKRKLSLIAQGKQGMVWYAMGLGDLPESSPNPQDPHRFVTYSPPQDSMSAGQ